jgi:transcriptional regulator with XRE-family HTH domain
MREQKNMTQEQLAEKVGTKSYISRIENNASDIRLSTLMRIYKTSRRTFKTIIDIVNLTARTALHELCIKPNKFKVFANNNLVDI